MQEQVFRIPLTDVQFMRTIHPNKKGKVPAVDIDYGSPAAPKKITIRLKQVMTFWSVFISLCVFCIFLEQKGIFLVWHLGVFHSRIRG